MTANPNDVRIVYKMHPLPSHPFAQIAAQAALAAQEQGKFMQMHELLMGRMATFNKLGTDKAAALGLPPEQRVAPEVQEAIFSDFATELGLDLNRFKATMKADTTKKRIEAETREVVAVGAGGTPASFVNGRYIRGAAPVESFQALVDEALKGGAGKAATK